MQINALNELQKGGGIMSAESDFEKYWLTKFSNCLDAHVGEEIRKTVMEGSEELSERSDRLEVIAWSKQAMDRLDSLVDDQNRREIMTGCACQYPKSDLKSIREAYETTGDINMAHRMLQEQFESFLKNTLKIDDEIFKEIVSRGWGAAGVKRGDTITATKIPKSGYLIEYMKETDPEKKRQLYCHCQRVRDVLKSSETISPTYCYCGAGYYKGIWEEILQKPVKVELLASVIRGDDVCAVTIYLPSSIYL
jgi:predicted hydrocarbon binding protein